MTEPTMQQALALAIVEQMRGDGFIFANPEQAACVALAAIMETQRLDAELADKRGMEGSDEALTADCIAQAIRTGEHYAAQQGGVDADHS